MERLHREGTASADRLSPFSYFEAGRRFGAVGALSLGGAVLALAALVGLTFTGAPAGAAFPGTNGKIACHGPGDRTSANPDAEDDFEIFTINPDGTNFTLLTNNGPFNVPGDSTSGRPQEFGPAYSPDGTKVAFESTRTGGSELFIMNADGTNVKRLTFALGDDAAPHFSPDGRQIVFTAGRNDGQFEVYRIDADGTNETRLTFNPGNDGRASWSPDGRRIAFETSRPSNSSEEPGGGTNPNNEIATMNPDGSDIVLLTDTVRPVIHRSTRWSPDGSQIVFDSNRDEPAATTPPNNNDIYKMNRDGSNITRLTTNAGNEARFSAIDQLPQFSPDGTKIVFDSARDSQPPGPNGEPAVFNLEVYTMNADGSGETRITNQLGTDSRCDWEPIPIQAAVPPAPQPPSGGNAPPPQTGNAARILPNMFRPRASARQVGRKIVVRVRGRMGDNQRRSCAGRLKMGIRFATSRRVTRVARMGANCRYSKRVAFPVRRLPRASRARSKPVIVRVAVRFQGNRGLLSDVSPTRRVKVRR